MSSSFQMWSATPAAIAARGDLGCQDVGSVKLTHYRLAPRTPGRLGLRTAGGGLGRGRLPVARDLANPRQDLSFIDLQ